MKMKNKLIQSLFAIFVVIAIVSTGFVNIVNVASTNSNADVTMDDVTLEGVSYIIVHALNPEAIEIASIEGMDQYCVGIYDGDTLIGYGAHDNETYNKPIAISSGAHTVKAVFNGMTESKNINIAEGNTQQLFFIFSRTKHIFDYSASASLSDSMSWNLLNPHPLNKILQDFSCLRLYIRNGCGESGNSSGNYISKVKYSLDVSNFFAEGSAQITVENGEGQLFWNEVFVDGNGDGIDINIPIQIFNRWYVQTETIGEYPVTNIRGSNHDYTLIAWQQKRCSPMSAKQTYNKIDFHHPYHIYRSYVSIKDGSGIDSFSVTGTLNYLKMASVPYDLTGTGITCEGVKPPVASFTYSPENPMVGEEITFDASSSYDPDGEIVSHNWYFGDRNSTEGKVVTHAYSKAGNYTVTLTVTDNDGLQGSTSKVVEVKDQLTIVVWTSGHFVSVEEDWSQTATVPIHVEVLDYQDNPVEGAAILLDGFPYGQTDVNGRLDFLWPIPDSPPIEGSFSTKVEAQWYHLSAESDIILYNAERLENPRTAELKTAEAFMYNLIRQLKLYSDRPSIVWDLYNVIVSIFEHYTEYHARANDVVATETYNYTAPDVAPAWLIRETVVRDSQVIVELNSWTEKEIKYLEATSPIPSDPFLNRGGLLINIASPAIPYITAPDGSHAGYDPLTGELVFDFPIAISGLGDEPFQMFIPHPAEGEYLLSVVGTMLGNYTLSIQVLDSSGVCGNVSSFTRPISKDEIHTYSIDVPISGCYIGGYLGCGPEDLNCESIQEFNQKMNKNHAIFLRYLDIADSRNPAHWEWAEEVKRTGAMPMFIYDPYDGLDNIDISDIEYFALKCGEFNETVFIVFGHDLNGPWYPWGNDPENYTNKLKEVAEIFHREASNVEMCWVPNQNWGYPWGGVDYGDGYSEYYPEGMGAYGEYVDWVGLNLYEKDWDEDNIVPPDMFVANIRNGQNNTDFYEMFAVGKNKPMLIAETGVFDPNKDPTSPGERNPLNETEQAEFKNEWLKQVYNVSTLKGEFPRLNAICYFHVNKTEPVIDTQSHSFYNILADYRIPEDPNVYKDLISDSYFIGVENQPPIANFTYSPEKPVVNETITFNASASHDPDCGNITNYEWDFGDGNITNTTEAIITHSYSEARDYMVNLTVEDEEGTLNTTSKTITVHPQVIFDTETPANPYPSIFGIHNGTITPNQTVTANKLYTYPCVGTGGHTEYVRIWNSTLDVNATWNGYVGDWHNITFDEPFTLFAEKTYYYEVRTGSYPQIIHTDEWEAKGGMGIINCTSFVNANGKIYANWIPAIRLWAG